MAPGRDPRSEARVGRYRRHRDRRLPLARQAAAVARQPVSRAVPVHRTNPAIQTALGLVEIGAFCVLVLTGSPIALGVLVLALVAFIGAYSSDTRAVIALADNGEGALLAAGRSGRPTGVIGAAVLDEPLPASPTGLAMPVRLNGATWWIDRSSYPALKEPG